MEGCIGFYEFGVNPSAVLVFAGHCGALLHYLGKTTVVGNAIRSFAEEFAHIFANMQFFGKKYKARVGTPP